MFDQVYENSITKSYRSINHDISLLALEGAIESITFSEFFEIGSNVVGGHCLFAIEQLIRRFGPEKTLFSWDVPIEFEDGDVQMDMNFDELGLILTVLLNGKVISATAY